MKTISFSSTQVKETREYEHIIILSYVTPKNLSHTARSSNILFQTDLEILFVQSALLGILQLWNQFIKQYKDHFLLSRGN